MHSRRSHGYQAADDNRSQQLTKGWLMSSSSVTISARFPQGLLDEAQQRAEQSDRTLSSLLRISLRERLEREADHDHTDRERSVSE
jgi:hypothetical protein